VDWPQILANLQKLPAIVKEEFGPLAIWVGLIAPAISAAIGATLSTSHTLYLLLVYYLLVGLFATISKLTNLQIKQERKIDVLWGGEHPYVHYGEFLNVGPITKLWRIGVYNESAVNSACDVEVKLTKMEPRVNVVIPATLHRMGDNTIKPLESYETKTDIHPGDPKYFDVIGQLKSGSLFIYYADKLLPFTLPVRTGPNQYRITIVVSGKDIPARARDFKTFMDNKGQLMMEPEGESYEPLRPKPPS
jgi:hypothetical protein